MYVCLYVCVCVCVRERVFIRQRERVWLCKCGCFVSVHPIPLESPLGTVLGTRLVSSGSCSVEVLEEWDLVSSAARDCSMLIRLLDEGSCRYFSGTYPT